MKKSICQDQAYSRPYLAIHDLRRCINIQFKVNEYNVTERKRWSTLPAYLEYGDKYVAKRVPVKIKDGEPVKVIKKISESEDTSKASSCKQSSSSSTSKYDSNLASSTTYPVANTSSITTDHGLSKT
ncbi:unnamed protein product [Adineta ricciae]|uniref:Uncharacterized protein n=1 Tax=Adineta ricciae TaxID=249248 RepID=A0A815UG96_ADIRI|nr:unnamed protein product [Adineta ricciae]